MPDTLPSTTIFTFTPWSTIVPRLRQVTFHGPWTLPSFTVSVISPLPVEAI